MRDGGFFIDALGYEDANRPLVLQEEIEGAKHLTQQVTSCVAGTEEIAA